jgi:hypothetical protein
LFAGATGFAMRFRSRARPPSQGAFARGSDHTCKALLLVGATPVAIGVRPTPMSRFLFSRWRGTPASPASMSVCREPTARRLRCRYVDHSPIVDSMNGLQRLRKTLLVAPLFARRARGGLGRGEALDVALALGVTNACVVVGLSRSGCSSTPLRLRRPSPRGDSTNGLRRCPQDRLFAPSLCPQGKGRVGEGCSS